MKIIKSLKTQKILLRKRELEYPEKYNLVKIEDLFKITRGKVISSTYIEENQGIYPVYSSASTGDGSIGNIDSFNLEGKKLTWTTDGFYAGAVFYRKGRYNCTNVCGILELKEIGSEKYFSYLLKPVLPKYVTKTDNRKLMSGIVSKIPFIYNTDVLEQNKIATALSKQEDQVNNIKTLIEKLEKRNQYYAERLLSGELRVREGDDGKVEFYENEDWANIKLNHYLKKEDFKMPSDWIKGIFSEHSKFTVGTPLHARNFNFDGKGIQYLRTGDVWEDASSSKEIAYYDGNEIEDKFIKHEGDYLISLKGYNDKIGEGTLGLVTNYENKKGIVCDNMYLVQKKEIDLVEYTACVTRLNYIQNLILRTAVGSTARFATKMINKIEWIFPSDKLEMLLINSVLKDFELEISKLRKTKYMEQKRFDWMSDALLSGEYQIVD